MEKDFYEGFQKDLDGLITKNCEAIIRKSKDCVDLQEKLIEAYEKQELSVFCDIIMQIQITAGITCYKLAAQEIYGLLES